MGDGANCNSGITNVHADITGNVVVDNCAQSTLFLCNISLFFKGIGTTGNEGYFAGNVNACVVCRSTYAGNGYVLDGFFGFVFAKDVVNEVLFFCNAVGGLYEIDDLVVVKNVGSLCAVN